MHKNLALALLFLGALSTATSALALDKRTRFMAANCAYCHGPDGKSSSAIPALAGMDKGQFVAAMKSMKAGERTGGVMYQIAAGYTDEEIEAMAAWFANIK